MHPCSWLARTAPKLLANGPWSCWRLVPQHSRQPLLDAVLDGKASRQCECLLPIWTTEHKTLRWSHKNVHPVAHEPPATRTEAGGCETRNCVLRMHSQGNGWGEVRYSEFARVSQELSATLTAEGPLHGRPSQIHRRACGVSHRCHLSCLLCLRTAMPPLSLPTR